MVNRFIAIIAMNLSIVRGPRPFLIGFHPFGSRFPVKVLILKERRRGNC